MGNSESIYIAVYEENKKVKKSVDIKAVDVVLARNHATMLASQVFNVQVLLSQNMIILLKTDDVDFVEARDVDIHAGVINMGEWRSYGGEV